jgi:hypothetical protein
MSIAEFEIKLGTVYYCRGGWYRRPTEFFELAGTPYVAYESGRDRRANQSKSSGPRLWFAKTASHIEQSELERLTERQPKMIPNPLYCETCDGLGYLVAEPYAVQCPNCADRRPARGDITSTPTEAP